MEKRHKCSICGKYFSGEGAIGPTCLEHQGEIGRYYHRADGPPDPDVFVSLVELCDEAQRFGKSRYWAVKLTGGDAGVNPPQSPEFTIYLFGKRKFCRREALITLRHLVVIDKKG